MTLSRPTPPPYPRLTTVPLVTLGARYPNAACTLLGHRTFDALPVALILRSASSHDTTSAPSCSQCATDASSHQSSSFTIAFLCAPAVINARIAAPLSHTVIVQNVHSRSGNSAPPKNPAARFACCVDRHEYHANPGRNRTDRTLNRVTLTQLIATASSRRPPATPISHKKVGGFSPSHADRKILYGLTGGSVAGSAVLMHVGCPNPCALTPVPPFGFGVMS